MKPRMAFDTSSLRRASANTSLPWMDRLVTLIHVGQDGVVTQATSDGDKRAMLRSADDQDLVLAAWPGDYRQDVFVVDDLSAARLANGLSRHRQQPEPVEEKPPVRPSWTSEPRSGDLLSWLAASPNLPVEGQRQVTANTRDYSPFATLVTLVGRPDLDPQVRQQIFGSASEWQAPGLIASVHTTQTEARDLVARFPEAVAVLEAGLRRSDTSDAVRARLTKLSYINAAQLWVKSTDWSDDTRPELAATLLPLVLNGTPPDGPLRTGWGAERYERSNLIRSMIATLPDERLLELLRDTEYGPLVRRAYLAADKITEDLLLECLPEILRPHDGVEPVPALLQYVQRYPQLMNVAGDQVRAAAGKLVADGWSPSRAAQEGAWSALAIAATTADHSDLLDGLVHAVVHDAARHRTHLWSDLSRHKLLELLLDNRGLTDEQIRHLLDRLSNEHVEEIHRSTRERSRVSRLCDEVLRTRRPQPGQSLVVAPHPRPTLPTDEELAAVENPQAVLRDLMKQPGPDRDAATKHALNSHYMTEDLAWRAPVRALEHHPRFGPLLAAEIIEICADSPARWQEFAASQRSIWNTQLSAATLFKRLKEA